MCNFVVEKKTDDKIISKEMLILDNILKNNGVLLFDFGTILVGLSKERCVRALEQIGCGRIAYYVDECRQEDLFHDLEIGGSVEAFCDEARRQSSYTDEKGVYHPCKATNDEICWAWNQLLLDIPVEKLRLIYHLHHDLGVHTAVLSNTNQIHWQYAVKHLFTADGLSVNDYFDEIFLSCDMQMVKPDDCIYQEMLRQLREDYDMPALQPHDILFIDDSEKNCMAAEANGIRTLHDPKGDKWILANMSDNLSTIPPQTGGVACIGNFDGVHLGHQHVISTLKHIAAERGLRPVVITFDRHPRALFDPKFLPEYLTTLEEKEALLRKQGVEVRVLPFTQQLADVTACEFMQRKLHGEMNVKLLLLGYDNRFGKRNDSETIDDYKKYGETAGIEVMVADAVDVEGERISSSYVRHLIKQGEVEKAQTALGYRYGITGSVIHGREEGRKMGIPTANLSVPYGKMIPAHGAYATLTNIDGKEYRSVTNIGMRPTLDNGRDVTVETHVIGFSGNLYGKVITVKFVHRLRDERRYDTVEELRRQIETDINTVTQEES